MTNKNLLNIKTTSNLPKLIVNEDNRSFTKLSFNIIAPLNFLKCFLVFFLFSKVKSDQFLGCFENVSIAKPKHIYIYQTPSYCISYCSGYQIVGLKNGNECYCLNSISKKHIIDKSKCDIDCPGFGKMKCGGLNTYGVYVLPFYKNVDFFDNNEYETTTSVQNFITTTSDYTEIRHFENSQQDQTKSSEEVIITSSPEVTEVKSVDKNNLKIGLLFGFTFGFLFLMTIMIAILFLLKKLKKPNNDYAESLSQIKFPNNSNLRGSIDAPIINPFTNSSGDKNESGIAKTTEDSNFYEIIKFNPEFDEKIGKRRISDGTFIDDLNYKQSNLHIANPDTL